MKRLGAWGKASWAGFRQAGTMVAVVGALALTATETQAQVAPDSGAVVIGNDRGGSIRERMVRIRALRISGQPVRIEGDICYSACTMMIGLPSACVNPGTTFGFHGPSFSGRPMSTADFDHTSRVMASYYPPSIRNWFMSEARHEILSVTRVSGAELIRHGVKSCG